MNRTDALVLSTLLGAGALLMLLGRRLATGVEVAEDLAAAEVAH